MENITGHGARSSLRTVRPRIGRVALATLAFMWAIFSPSAALASDADQSGRVIGGTAVSQADVSATGHWSAVVAVFATDAQGTRLCTGTLIAPNWVATAGHCIAQTADASQAISPANVFVAPGITSVSTAGDHLINAVSTHVHPGFSWTNASWDVALIELQNTVPATPFALPDPSRSADSYSVGSTENVAGFGRSQAANNTSSGTLRSGRLEQVNASACEQYNPGSGQYSDCYLPGSQRQATCFGDSGGPLVRYDASGAPVLWGITSTGPDPCDAATNGSFAPSYETRVSAVADWLNAVRTGSTFVPSAQVSGRNATVSASTTGAAATPAAVTTPAGAPKTIKAPAGGTGIGIFQNKVASMPSARKAGLLTLSASFIGSAGTGSAVITRCVRSKCVTVSTSAIVFASAGATVATKIKVPRCVAKAVMTLKLSVTDSQGVARDSASQRIVKCK